MISQHCLQVAIPKPSVEVTPKFCLKKRALLYSETREPHPCPSGKKNKQKVLQVNTFLFLRPEFKSASSSLPDVHSGRVENILLCCHVCAWKYIKTISKIGREPKRTELVRYLALVDCMMLSSFVFQVSFEYVLNLAYPFLTQRCTTSQQEEEPSGWLAASQDQQLVFSSCVLVTNYLQMRSKPRLQILKCHTPIHWMRCFCGG